MASPGGINILVDDTGVDVSSGHQDVASRSHNTSTISTNNTMSNRRPVRRIRIALVVLLTVVEQVILVKHIIRMTIIRLVILITVLEL